MSKIYLFYGEEKYDLELRVQKIKKEFTNLEIGINLFYLDLQNIDELESICQGVSFFGEEKLIIIKDTKLKIDVDLLNDAGESTTIILIEDTVDKRLSQYKAISKIGEVVEFKPMDSNQMVDYIIKMLSRYNVKISKADAIYMESICLDDKSNIINELNKIVNYLDGEDTVTKDMIDKVCSKNFSAKIFDLLDDIVKKNKKKALYELDELLTQKEPIVKIYIMLYKQIKQIYLIKVAKQNRLNDIAKTLEINPYVFKNLSRVVDGFTIKELKDIIYAFDEYDAKTKSGEMDFEIGLKKIIYSM